MNLLTTPAQIKNKLILLIEECTSMQIAVAWGTANHDVYKVLIENQDKINKLVVGTHFFQTDPNFLEAFLDNDKIRVIYETGEVFHPKIYYFRLKDRWECLVGSANFTNGAMSKNKEILVSFSSDDKEVHQTEQEIWMIIKDWFNEGHIITNEYLLNYKKHYDSKKELLNNLSTSKTKDENSDFYKNDIFNYSWEEYFHKILNEDYHGSDSIHDRLKVLSSAKELFRKDKFFNLSEEERRKISGYEEWKEDSEFDWQWFGSMKPEGTFKGLVKSNNENLSLALDQIPLEGSLTKEHYLAFLNYYKLAIPENSNRLSGATRLLAMKRPDYFFCLDSKNKKRFCQDFDIKEKDLHIDTYWDTVVDKITSCLWWSEKSKSEKSNKIEIETWNGRAAFLDAVYYKKSLISNPKKYINKFYPELINKNTKIISSRMWEKNDKKDYLDNWWFKFNSEDIEKYEFIVFAGAQDYENEEFCVLKVETSFLLKNKDNIDVNANGKMYNIYLSFEDYIDLRHKNRLSFKQFLV